MSNLVKKIQTKVENNKFDKKNKLLKAAYQLFTEKGINNTSIQDIVEKAGVAKGTFYLYFKDKYELQEKLIIQKSYDLFHMALDHLNTAVITEFDDQLIFVIDYVINELINSPELVKIIYKDLSLGFYQGRVSNLIDKEEIGIYQAFMEGIHKNNIKLDNPSVTLYMIIELVGSTCFNSIIKKEPLPMEEFKPYLYQTIRLMLHQN